MIVDVFCQQRNTFLKINLRFYTLTLAIKSILLILREQSQICCMCVYNINIFLKSAAHYYNSLLIFIYIIIFKPSCQTENTQTISLGEKHSNKFIALCPMGMCFYRSSEEVRAKFFARTRAYFNYRPFFTPFFKKLTLYTLNNPVCSSSQLSFPPILQHLKVLSCKVCFA